MLVEPELDEEPEEDDMEKFGVLREKELLAEEPDPDPAAELESVLVEVDTVVPASVSL